MLLVATLKLALPVTFSLLLPLIGLLSRKLVAPLSVFFVLVSAVANFQLLELTGTYALHIILELFTLRS